MLDFEANIGVGLDAVSRMVKITTITTTTMMWESRRVGAGSSSFTARPSPGNLIHFEENKTFGALIETDYIKILSA